MEVELIEKAIGRQLNESERRTVEWLNGWEMETRINVMTLILAAHAEGKRSK